MSRREDLIKRCRYYKGEKENPFEGKDQTKAMFWFYEEVYVQEFLAESSNLVDCYSEYVAYGMEDFSKDDDVPTMFKALLFNRYYHGDGGSPSEPSSFKKWYLKNYLNRS